MKYLVQFLIILAFCLAGELLHELIPLPIPASIYGIALLFAALELKVVRPHDIQEVSSFLTGIMPLLFLPPAVGLMESWGILKGSLAAYLVTILVSTFLVMAVSGWSTEAVIRLKSRRDKR